MNIIQRIIIILIAVQIKTAHAQSIQKVSPVSILKLTDLQAVWAENEFEIDSVAAEGDNWCVLAKANMSAKQDLVWRTSAYCVMEGRKGIIRLPVGAENLTIDTNSLGFALKDSSGKKRKYRLSVVSAKQAMLQGRLLEINQLDREESRVIGRELVSSGSALDSEPNVVQMRVPILADNGDIFVVQGTTERIDRYSAEGELKSSTYMQLDPAFIALGFPGVKKHPLDSGLSRFTYAWKGPGESALLFLTGVPFQGETSIASVDLTTGLVREVVSLLTPKRGGKGPVDGPLSYAFYSVFVQGNQFVAASREGVLAFYPFQFKSKDKR